LIRGPPRDRRKKGWGKLVALWRIPPFGLSFFLGSLERRASPRGHIYFRR